MPGERHPHSWSSLSGFTTKERNWICPAHFCVLSVSWASQSLTATGAPQPGLSAVGGIVEVVGYTVRAMLAWHV